MFGQRKLVVCVCSVAWCWWNLLTSIFSSNPPTHFRHRHFLLKFQRKWLPDESNGIFRFELAFCPPEDCQSNNHFSFLLCFWTLPGADNRCECLLAYGRTYRQLVGLTVPYHLIMKSYQFLTVLSKNPNISNVWIQQLVPCSKRTAKHILTIS